MQKKATSPPESPQFVAWFRSVAPYFHSFRGKTFVVAFGGEVVNRAKFFEFAHDLNLLHSAGIRVVLVHGSRPQIEAQLKQRKGRSRYHKQLRITDPIALECVKEAVGLLRVEIEQEPLRKQTIATGVVRQYDSDGTTVAETLTPSVDSTSAPTLNIVTPT